MELADEGDAMPVSLSIKSVPDPIARLLRQRAAPPAPTKSD